MKFPYSAVVLRSTFGNDLFPLSSHFFLQQRDLPCAAFDVVWRYSSTQKADLLSIAAYSSAECSDSNHPMRCCANFVETSFFHLQGSSTSQVSSGQSSFDMKLILLQS
jgi:hypothetical protein